MPAKVTSEDVIFRLFHPKYSRYDIQKSAGTSNLLIRTSPEETGIDYAYFAKVQPFRFSTSGIYDRFHGLLVLDIIGP